MDLHRSGAKPDWVDVKRPNIWQKIALVTGGWITPGNCISLIGLIATLAGVVIVADQLLLGIAFIVGGRLLDIIDGIVADKTGTKSGLGEMVDASFDKIALFAVALGLVTTGLVWWPVLVLLVAQNLANTIIVFIARANQRQLHPSAWGKLATFCQWLGIILLMGGHLWQPLLWLGYIGVVAGMYMGIIATWHYTRTAK